MRSVYLAFVVSVSMMLGCDAFGPDSQTDKTNSKPDLGVRTLEQIADSQNIDFATGPPVVFKGDRASTEEFKLSGVLQSSEDMITTRFLLQFEASGKRTPRFLMEVDEEGKYETASLDYFVQWKETKESLIKSYDGKGMKSIDISDLVSPGDTLKVFVMRVYPDTTLSVKTVYEYDLNQRGKTTAFRAYTEKLAQ